MVVVILGILLAVAFPGYQVWIENIKIRNQAESIQNALALARAESTRRNLNIDFVLTNSVPDSTVAGVSVGGSTTGRNWLMRANTGFAFTTADYIQSKLASEGASNVTIDATGVANAAGNPGVITFTGLGRIDAGAVQTINISNASLSASDARNLRVMISRAGLVRMCDPSLQLKNNDPKHC